jgi:peptidylprolyl isomerase
VAQIKKLAREGKYDGVVFHRVIDGFMAQTGDPDGTGMGGMGDTLPAEFNGQPHTRGAVSMARAQDPNSARSQFFIVLKDSNFLDRQYTVWGRVTSGMEFVDKIKKGAPGSGAVSPPADKMIKVRLASDPNP